MKIQLVILVSMFAFSIVFGCSNREPAGNSERESNKRSSDKTASNAKDNNIGGKAPNGRTGKGETPNRESGAPLRARGFSFLTDDIVGVAVVHPRRMLAKPIFADEDLAQLIDEALPELGFSVAELEQVVWLLVVPEKLRRTLISAQPDTPQRPDKAASTDDVVKMKQFEPPVDLDDLFTGLEPASPVPPDEDQSSDFDPGFESEPIDVQEPALGMDFHAFDAYWTPKSLPMILRFAESSKAEHLARVLIKGMTEAKFKNGRYYKQPGVSGKPPMLSPENSPAIRQYLELAPMCVYLPDAFTVVLASESRMQEMLAVNHDQPPDSSATTTRFETLIDATDNAVDAGMAIDVERLRENGTHESLLEELSDRFLASRMALLNLSDDASTVTLSLDASSSPSIELEINLPSDPTTRGRLSRSVANVMRLVSDQETKEAHPLAKVIVNIASGMAVWESDDAIVIRTEQLKPVPEILAQSLERIVVETNEALWRHGLEQIAFAMQNYAAERNRLPPAASYDEAGKPLLSWRVHLLPYLGHDELYEQFHLDEVWNSPHNITLLDRMPSVYGDLAADTRVFVFTGEGTMFDPRLETSEAIFSSRQNSSKILAIRSRGNQGIAWTEPKDIVVNDKPIAELLGEEGLISFLAVFCDGTVRNVVPTDESQSLAEMIKLDAN